MEAPENTSGLTVTYGFTQVVGAMVVVIMAIWMGHFRGGFAWHSNVMLEFNWHPMLMSVGLIFLYGNAILVYRVFRNEKKKTLKLAHAILHSLVFILVVIALKAVFDSHNLNHPPFPNLYSLHSWTGITTVTLFTCQLLVGFVTFLFPGLKSSLRSAYLPVHVFFGLTIFIMAVATALMGILEKAILSIGGTYSDLGPEAVMINMLGLLIILFAVLVVYLVSNPRFKRHSHPEDELLLTDTLAE